jgi:uncharacterized protein with von Willebrand factor type A (vWA) domain
VTYPFGSLPGNLAAFCDVLRREHRFLVGPRELQDAARALEATRLADERVVRDALRPVLCSSLEDVKVFDRAFRTFFLRADRRADLEAQATPSGPARASRGQGGVTAAPDDGDNAEGDNGGGKGPITAWPADEGDSGTTGARRLVRASYSPLQAEGPPPELGPPDPAWRHAASAFVQRLDAGLSRRWRPAAQGQRFDFRRTLRSSLHTGGEAVLPRWQARRTRRSRLVLLVDGSRSMSAHAHIALQMGVGLAAVTLNVDVFTFSTALRQVTDEVRRAAAGRRRRLGDLHRSWGGGTAIGACLQEFRQRFGERLIGPNTVVIVASDGLDVGGPAVLADAMAHLHQRAAGIVWLNPLLDTPGYEPTALGMHVARPYVTTFASVAGPADLLRLSRLVRLRAR